MIKINYKQNILISLVGCTLLFGACTDNIDVSSSTATSNTGQFVNVFDSDVKYHCDKKMVKLSDNGDFQCQSFPIAFYMDEVKLGEISSIHNDGYVFPQDIVTLEESDAVYSSYSSMTLATAQ